VYTNVPVPVQCTLCTGAISVYTNVLDPVQFTLTYRCTVGGTLMMRTQQNTIFYLTQTRLSFYALSKVLYKHSQAVPSTYIPTMLYTSIIISATILRNTKLFIRPSWQCINGKRGSVSLDTRKGMTAVTCRSVHYSFDPKVGSLSMIVVLTFLYSCLGSHSVYWVGLHWTAIFVRMLHFGPSGVQQAPVQYGPMQYPVFKPVNNTKVIQNTEHWKTG